MATAVTSEPERETVERTKGLGGCLLWFLWGVALSFMTILSLVLIALLVTSVGLNLYLVWEMSGLQVSINRPAAIEQQQAPLIIPGDVLAAIPTQTPKVSTPPSTAELLAPVGTPTSAVTTGPALEEQIATLAALTTQVAGAQSGDASASLSVPTATSSIPPAAAPTADAIGAPRSEASTSEPDSIDPPAAESSETQPVERSEAPREALTTSNSYSLIPIDGERDSRPLEENGDLNLSLRDPQPLEVELTLVDAGVGIDPDAPKLSGIFEPNIVAAYTVHNWDWDCNCRGALIQEEDVVLVGLETTPGEPIFIPPRVQDIYAGKFYAVVLYASQDSLTFVYAREGTIARGYTIHYQGLRTDPNLLALYRESQGNQLPGLTLDTPVGSATEELIVAVRDNGKFLDARSINDWWD